MGERFVGIDWGNEEHAVCVLDAAGTEHSSFTAAHTEAGLADLTSRLTRLQQQGDVRVAIERTNGVVVDRLVEAGLRIVPLHPNAVKATRPRYSAAGGKDDRRDAYILADVLRTDGARLDELHGPSDETRALKALVRTRDDLVTARVEMTNRLRAELESFWPAPVEMFNDLDSLIALKFLDKYPTPKSAKSLNEAKLAKFLQKHSYTGSRKPEEFMRRARQAAVGRNGERETESKGAVVRALVVVVRSLVEQCSQLESRIKRDVAAHPDGPLVQSFPYSGSVNAAQILTELGDDRERFQSAEHLAAEAGVVPVTESSGKRSHKKKRRGKPPAVFFRRACNKRLRKALTCFADNSRRASAWADDIYRKAINRGCSHPHAIRVLARAWARVIWRCWRDRRPYDPAQHGGAQRVAS